METRAGQLVSITMQICTEDLCFVLIPELCRIFLYCLGESVYPDPTPHTAISAYVIDLYEKNNGGTFERKH